MTRLAILLSTGFGIGYTPFAPGTMASLLALPIGYFLLLSYGIFATLFCGLLVIAIGLWASGAHAQAISRTDPGSSVVDEVAGQILAMLPIVPVGQATDALPVALAFLLFRFFDIIKPWPISSLERLHGGLGIMADDVASGLAAAAILFAIMSLGWI